MSTRIRRPSTASSSSPKTAKMKKIAAVKPISAKKRTALGDVTNTRNGSQIRVPTSLSRSKPLVPCSAKTTKVKDESSICKFDKGLSTNTLPGFSCVKSDALAPSKNVPLQGNKQSTVGNRTLAVPSSIGTFFAAGSAATPPSRFDVSPSRSTDGSVSLDETMSTCDSLKSPEIEYVDNEYFSEVKSIKMVANNNLLVSEDVYQGSMLKQDILVEMEPAHGFLVINENSTDPQYCADVDSDIYEHLRASEAKKRPSVDFMEKVQKDITACMRATLVDWLVEVAEEYKLLPETLFLTVNYIDRYLSGNVMNRQQLQLLGVACMVIAAKYEEICPPRVDEFCYITDNTYQKEEVLHMESSVLNYLKFEMTAPTVKCFLRQFVRVAQATNEISSMKFECLANYIVELSLLDYNMLRYSASLTAASAIFLSKFILSPSKRPWNSCLARYTHYQPYELCDCVKALHRLCCNSHCPKLPAIREKYSQHNYKFVAKKYCPPSIPPELFEI
ncbi:cyclin-A1-4-like [Tripterygium wilfordii]|uniref:cyclin-A1-4-like n=1 Tax=Tripterygium wilfordii TaxID=458696 RepID=UPI0018F83CD7|nr:cyclin-A1-4-like [Tripterygium wilfordii]